MVPLLLEQLGERAHGQSRTLQRWGPDLDVAGIDRLTFAFRIILAEQNLPEVGTVPQMETMAPMLQHFGGPSPVPHVMPSGGRLLRLGVQARVAAATSGFLIFFNTSSNAAGLLPFGASRKDQPKASDTTGNYL